MDDDETVLSAYVFIETVAAIVIQTAIRQFLAVLHVDSLRQTRDTIDVADRVLSIEESCLEESMFASSRGNSSLESVNGYLHESLLDDDLDRVALDLYDLAAIQIQAMYRDFGSETAWMSTTIAPLRYNGCIEAFYVGKSISLT
jgi:hypothetical protein